MYNFVALAGLTGKFTFGERVAFASLATNDGLVFAVTIRGKMNSTDLA
jgi:hypothetical protein